MKKEQMRSVWILPNNDAGSSLVRAEILDSMEGDEVYDNLSRDEYLKFLKNCHCIVGNSSSGILEAPFYKVPAVNIGNRQNGRMQSKNVVNCGNSQEEITNALRMVDKIEKNQIKSIYGDGMSSERIIKLLVKLKNNKNLLNKRITF